MSGNGNGDVVASTEPSTVDPHRGGTEPPQSPATTPLYMCSHCGSTVVPIEVTTGRGVRNKCPECQKFMSLITVEEARAREEARIETGPLAPTRVEMLVRLRDLLELELPKVYGIPKREQSKRILAIVDTLNPAVASNRWNLHNHIKNFAPNADDRHLESVINKIFWDLEDEGYLPSEGGYRPRYPSRDGRGQYPGYRPSYAPRNERGFDEGPYDGGYGGGGYGGRGYGGGSYDGRRSRGSMTIVVDGMTVQTNFQGYMAYQRWMRNQDERDERRDRSKGLSERDRQEHDLRMKRLEAEIVKINSETGRSGSGNMVDVKVGKTGEEQTLKVPATQALFYLTQNKSETLIPVKTGEGDEVIQVPASVAHLYLNRGNTSEVQRLREKLEDDRKEQYDKDTARLEKKIDDQPSFMDQLAYFEAAGNKLGLQRGGRTTMDILDSLRGDVQVTANQILTKLPVPGTEFNPDVSRTPAERRAKAIEVKRRLAKSEEILRAEDKLIKSASLVKSNV